MDGYKHYIRVNNDPNLKGNIGGTEYIIPVGTVIKGFTDGFLKEANGNEEILPGDLLLSGYDQRQFQLQLTDGREQFIYKIVNGALVARSQTELDVEYSSRPAPPPTELELLKAENETLNLNNIAIWEALIPLIP